MGIIDRAPAVLLTLALAGGLASCSEPDDATGRAEASPYPETTATTAHPAPTPRADGPEVVDEIVTGLAAPWGLAFLPDGSALVTERDTGRVLAVEERRGGYASREVGRIDEAAPQGEAGLLGVAVSPTFAEDRRVFLYVTTEADNRIIRTTYDGTPGQQRLGELEVILEGIPNGWRHDGGRLEFGPDGHLYASTGEIGESELAQDRSSLGGKILRITADGDPAPGNPDPGSPIWSWGHRNIQGLAFDDDDTLWASEFGDADWDELNRIQKDGNYGWPRVEGTGGQGEFLDPQVVWSPAEASPSGLAFLDGHLWLASLRGERLWRVDVRGGTATDPTDFFVGTYGRLRTVVVAPDGRLWVTTSNRDGRADPRPGDDRILVVEP